MGETNEFIVTTDNEQYTFKIIDKNNFLGKVKKLNVESTFKQVDFGSNFSIINVLGLINQKEIYDWTQEEMEQTGIKLIRTSCIDVTPK